jgi:hypothetical protein
MPPAKCLRYSLTCSLSHQVTIENLFNEVLLNIFDYFLSVSPQNWPTLVHTCRKWRHIVLAFPRTLHLRLFCTHGTPVQKRLDCWPTLPIVVRYGGSSALGPPVPEDEDHIMVALKQSHRVISISFTITTSLQERLATIERPFSELEDLVLLSRDSVRILSSAFLSGPWGTRLRSLHLTRTSLLQLPQLLYSSRNLVDLQLHEVLYPSNFSTEALTNAFSGMTQLRSLSLHYLPPTRHFPVLLPSRKRVALPSLTRFDFRGIPNFLKDLVATIDAPRLGDIEITFVNESISDLSDLSVLIEFIVRTEMHKSHSRARILSSECEISISLVQSGTPTRLELHVLCEPLSVQLSSMARICVQFSAFLFNVEDLSITAQPQSRQVDGLYSEQCHWLETINVFIGVKWLQVSGNLSRNILQCLQPGYWWHESVLPSLHKLYVMQPGLHHAPSREAVSSFITSRRLSGHPIMVEYERVCQCNISELIGTPTGTAHNQF